MKSNGLGWNPATARSYDLFDHDDNPIKVVLVERDRVPAPKPVKVNVAKKLNIPATILLLVFSPVILMLLPIRFMVWALLLKED